VLLQVTDSRSRPPRISDLSVTGYVTSYLQAILDRDRETAESIVLDAAKQRGMINGLRIIAAAQNKILELWGQYVIGVGDVRFAKQLSLSTITILANQSLKARVIRGRIGSRILLRCVEGEFDYEAMRRLAELLAHSGWKGEFYGPDSPISQVLAAVRAEGKRFDAIYLSAALLSDTATLAETIQELKEEPLLSDARTVIVDTPQGYQTGERHASYWFTFTTDTANTTLVPLMIHRLLSPRVMHTLLAPDTFRPREPAFKELAVQTRMRS
jgi:methanogenic corrinoid protein MtbC1